MTHEDRKLANRRCAWRRRVGTVSQNVQRIEPVQLPPNTGLGVGLAAQARKRSFVTRQRGGSPLSGSASPRQGGPDALFEAYAPDGPFDKIQSAPTRLPSRRRF